MYTVYEIAKRVISIVQAIKKGTTLKTQVYEYLKDQIIMQELKPGERLIEEKISEELKVSRSPIREAIRMLEKDGLLLVNSSGGVTVIQPSKEDFQYLFECRVEVEPLAAYYAAQRRSQDQLETIRSYLLQMEKITDSNTVKKVHDANVNFHEAIVEASLNPFLVSMITQLRGVNSFYRKSFLEVNQIYLEDAMRDHQRIFQAIVDQDADEAKRLMKAHIENDYTSFMRFSDQS
ncbi:GntR family transcriptional regulator [Heyndrickxia sp. NPDC080065]|uniref:GntR family transcriptional regulator n=1 Tax=Heyndrickxia sp. NPDC080065 TaxID=3390568 RepID=UPI003D02A0B2